MSLGPGPAPQEKLHFSPEPLISMRFGQVWYRCGARPRTSRHHSGSRCGRAGSRLAQRTRWQGHQLLTHGTGLCTILCSFLSSFLSKPSSSFLINMVSSLRNISCFLSYSIYRKKIAIMETPLQQKTRSMLLQLHGQLSLENAIATEVYLGNSELWSVSASNFFLPLQAFPTALFISRC